MSLPVRLVYWFMLLLGTPKPLVLCRSYIWMYLNYLYKPSNIMSAVLDSSFTNALHNGNHSSSNGMLTHSIGMELILATGKLYVSHALRIALYPLYGISMCNFLNR